MRHIIILILIIINTINVISIKKDIKKYNSPEIFIDMEQADRDELSIRQQKEYKAYEKESLKELEEINKESIQSIKKIIENQQKNINKMNSITKH